CCREAAVVGSRGSVRGCHICGAISWRRCTRLYGSSCYAAVVERACLVCEILADRFLAEGSCRVLPIPEGHPGLADYRRGIAIDWNYSLLFFPTKNAAISHSRLALVPGNAGSCYRARSSWRANHGGPLLLCSLNWFVHCNRVRIGGHRKKA